MCEVADDLTRATLENVKFVALLIFDIPSNNNVNIMPPRGIFIPNPWAGVGPAGMQGYIYYTRWRAIFTHATLENVQPIFAAFRKSKYR